MPLVSFRTGPAALTDDVPQEPLEQLPLAGLAGRIVTGAAHEPSAHCRLTSVSTAGLMMDFGDAFDLSGQFGLEQPGHFVLCPSPCVM